MITVAGLNVSMLHANYAEFVQRAKHWDFSRMTSAYWIKLVQEVLDTGSSEIVQKNHPIPIDYRGDVLLATYCSGSAGKDCNVRTVPQY